MSVAADSDPDTTVVAAAEPDASGLWLPLPHSLKMTGKTMAMLPPDAACCWWSQVRGMDVDAERWQLSRQKCVSAEEGCRKAHLAGREVEGRGRISK